MDKYDELAEKDAKRMAEIDDELVALAPSFEGWENFANIKIEKEIEHEAIYSIYE